MDILQEGDMASIESYTKKDGSTWYKVRFDYYDEGGVRRQGWKQGFKKKKDAESYETDIKYKLKNGLFVEPSIQTFSQYLQEWLNSSCVVPDVRETTRDGYLRCINYVKKASGFEFVDEDGKHKKINFSGIKLQDVKPVTIRSLFNVLRKIPRTVGGVTRPHFSETTIYNLYRVLSIAFNQAHEDGLVLDNPMSHIKAPKKAVHNHVFLTVEQANNLLSLAKDTRLYVPILLGGIMGMRRGEICGLTWDNVDIQNSKIHIKMSRTRISNKIITGEVKSKKSKRSLVMPAVLTKIMLEKRLGYIITKNNPDQLVVSDQSGKPINPCSLSHFFNDFLLKNNLPHMRFHDLRHTCAALMVAAGASPKEIADFLGHSTFTITMDLYADIFDQTKKQTAAKMNNLFKDLG